MKTHHWFLAALLPAAFGLAACHSYHVETTIENRTGAPIQQLEVTYPSATFGTDGLPSGGDYHYRIQILGDGPVKVEYTTKDGRHTLADGPVLKEKQEGRLEIVLLPAGKTEFHPELSPAF